MNMYREPSRLNRTLVSFCDYQPIVFLVLNCLIKLLFEFEGSCHVCMYHLIELISFLLNLSNNDCIYCIKTYLFTSLYNALTLRSVVV